MPNDDPIIITFPDVTLDTRNVLADSLADDLRGIHRSVEVKRQKERPDTMDLGATLVLVLGTAAVTEIAKGIGQWIARHKTEVRLSIGKTELTVSDADPEAVAEIVKALSHA